MSRFIDLRTASWTAGIRRGRAAAGRLGTALVNLVLPPCCVACNAECSPRPGDPMLCEQCAEELGPENWVGCRRCGALLAVGAGPADTCGACRGSRLSFDGVFPLGPYDGRLRAMVLRMKRPSGDAISYAVGHLLAQRRGGRIEPRPDVIVPIPMHWWRRVQRGVNSAEIVARCLARRLDIPMARQLVRHRHTEPQRDLLPRERFANVRGAFRIGRAAGSRWEGSHVLLVDDILTTGATCSEAARVLKKAGAASVAVAVVARAQGSY